jgi:hypothetical protein
MIIMVQDSVWRELGDFKDDDANAAAGERDEELGGEQAIE